tara:strand:- start:446 stop:748 length:303 start_codon:yes stop_codon:yes gene_type:complete
MALYTNITSAVPTVLADRGDNLNNITSVLITNTHDSTEVDIDLYIQDSSNNTFYLLKNTIIPVGVSLALTDNVKFNNSTSGYSLIAEVVAGSVDIHIKQN